MINRIKEIKNKLGNDLIILAHHYQTDDIVKLADFVGEEDGIRGTYIGQFAVLNDKLIIISKEN